MASPDTDQDRRALNPKAPEGTSPGTSRRMPPLAWIVIAGLLVVLAFAYSSWRGTAHTPSGGTMPMTQNQETVNPGAPAGPGPAPAAPAGQG